MDVSAAGSMEVVEHADAGGTHDEQVLRGDVHVVRERRERAAAHTRTRMAIQAELDKLVPSEISAAIPAEALQREREAVAARGGIVYLEVLQRDEGRRGAVGRCRTRYRC